MAGKSLRQIEEELAKLFTSAPKRSAIGEWIAEFKELEKEKSAREEEPENEPPVTSNETEEAENIASLKQDENVDEQPKEKEDNSKSEDTLSEN